jgi:hypothetical protein
LVGGRAIDVETQARMHPSETLTNIIRNVAVYRAARFIVVAETMKPMLQKT